VAWIKELRQKEESGQLKAAAEETKPKAKTKVKAKAKSEAMDYVSVCNIGDFILTDCVWLSL
jgi:hypothetical protein